MNALESGANMGGWLTILGLLLSLGCIVAFLALARYLVRTGRDLESRPPTPKRESGEEWKGDDYVPPYKSGWDEFGSDTTKKPKGV